MGDRGCFFKEIMVGLLPISRSHVLTFLLSQI